MNEHPHYWHDPLKNRFDITIESILEANGQSFIRIREPVVKPMGGGQAGDRGFIEISGRSLEFIDTILQDDEITLVMKMAPPKKGEAVLTINMAWRKAMMKNHTSEHLFVKAITKKHPGIDLGKIWVDGNHGTIILEGMPIMIEDILNAETEVQQCIAGAIPVITKIVSAGEIDESVRAREGVTTKHDFLRIVEIGDFDSSACSGLHVINTSEVIVFKVLDIKKEDSSTHIEFISGEKAVETLLELFNTALRRKDTYPFELQQLGAVLDKAKNLQDAYEEALQKIAQLMIDGPQREKIGEVEFWHEYLPGFDTNTMRKIMKEIKMNSAAIIFFFAPGDKSNLVFWTKNMPEEASFYIQETVTQLGGRGGGSKDSFTGGFTEVSDPYRLYQDIVNRVRSTIRTG
jgi:alanyl-tRNA synthetase